MTHLVHFIEPLIDDVLKERGDVTLFDSTVIFEYLEDAYPQPALFPKGAEGRAACRLPRARWRSPPGPRCQTRKNENRPPWYPAPVLKRRRAAQEGADHGKREEETGSHFAITWIVGGLRSER